MDDPEQERPAHALRRFLGVNELLMLVADHVPGSGDLRQICLVNKHFNDIFSEKLYRHIRLNSHHFKPDKIDLFVQNPRLKNTRVLSFEEIKGADFNVFYKLRFERSLFDTRPVVDGPLEEGLMRILRAVPSLRAFIGVSFVQSYCLGFSPISILGSSGHHLRSLELCLQIRDTASGLDFSFLSNVRALRLVINYDSDHHARQSRRDGSAYSVIARMLKVAANLEFLSLSTRREISADLIIDDICSSYKALNGVPLRLKALDLILDFPDGDKDFSWATKLGYITDLSFLESLYLPDIGYDDHTVREFRNLTSHEVLPSLRRLRMDGVSSREMYHDRFLDEVILHIDDKRWKQLEVAIEKWPDRVQQLRFEELMQTWNQPMFCIVSIHDFEAELSINPPGPWLSSIKSFSAPMIREQLDLFLANYMPLMTGLEGLEIIVPIGSSGYMPDCRWFWNCTSNLGPPHSWPKVVRDYARDIALTASKNCPQLRYFRFKRSNGIRSFLSWKIVRNADGISLVELDRCTDATERPKMWWSDEAKMLHVVGESP